MQQSSASPVLSQIALVIVVGAVATVLLPGVLLGVALGETLRRRGCKWTWPLLALPVLVPTTVVVAPSVDRLVAVAHGPVDIAAIVGVGAPLWLWASPLVSTAYMLRRSRTDRLHGGRAEVAVASAIGPGEALRRRTRGARRRHDEHVVHLGRDQRGDEVVLPLLRAHATIVGGSDTGKTNTAKVLLEDHVARGAGFVVLDGKGGRTLPRLAVQLAERHGRAVHLWSVNPFGDPDLDRHRLPWNPVGNGSPTEVKDRIASAEEQTEPYYKAVASRGLLIAAQVAVRDGLDVRLDSLASALDKPSAIRTTDTVDAAWLRGLNDGERSALRGIATRIRTMVAGDGGDALLPSTAAPQIDLLRAVRRGELVVFTLPEGQYPELIPHVGRYVLQTLTSVCSRLEHADEVVDALAFFDEFSAFDGDHLAAGFERGRSAGLRFVVATQSLSNFETAGGPKLLHAVLDNAEAIVIHRQAVPDSAELLASIGGTEESWEHTHQVSDARLGPHGWDETGTRARRLSARFRAHPNVIKELAMGEAVVISRRPAFAVRRVTIREYRHAQRERTPRRSVMDHVRS